MFRFTTIEDVILFDREHIGVLKDNNLPFGVGRHVASVRPDDNEFMMIKLDKPLVKIAGDDRRDEREDEDD